MFRKWLKRLGKALANTVNSVMKWQAEKWQYAIQYLAVKCRCVCVAMVKGESGVSMSKLMSAMLLALIGLMFLIYFIPQLESNVSSANITNTFVASFVDMMVWIVPIGGLLGIAYGIFRLFGGGRRD